MGIYVKNMKMPRTCAKCPFFEPYSIACGITHYFLDRDDYRFERDKDCSLVEISKPHGRLIDVENGQTIIEAEAEEEKNEKITQKQLIDYCNNAPWGHCSICPYDSKECKIYCTKYGTTPAGEHYHNPERYIDEDILIIEDKEKETK